MNEKFNNFEDEKDYTEEEYEEAFFDSLIDAMMNTFESLRNVNPEIAKGVESDYQEFLRYLSEYFYQNKTVAGSLGYILSKNPDNLWAYIISFMGLSQISKLLENPEEAEKYEEIFDEFRRIIEKRRRGQDIQ